jgi:hypothetical protein
MEREAGTWRKIAIWVDAAAHSFATLTTLQQLDISGPH